MEKVSRDDHVVRTDKWDKPYPSHSFSCEAVHGLPDQGAVGLTQPFPHLTDSLVRLLGRTDHPINPGSEVGRSANRC